MYAFIKNKRNGEPCTAHFPSPTTGRLREGDILHEKLAYQRVEKERVNKNDGLAGKLMRVTAPAAKSKKGASEIKADNPWHAPPRTHTDASDRGRGERRKIAKPKHLKPVI